MFNKLFPLALTSDPIDVACTLGTVINLILALSMGGIPWSAVTLLARAARQGARALSLVPEYFNVGRDDLTALLHFVFGTNRITRKDIDLLEKALFRGA